MNDPFLQALAVGYALINALNVVFTASLWAKDRNKLFAKLAWMWVFNLACFVAQAVIPQEPIWIGLGTLTCIPTCFLLYQILTEISGERLNWQAIWGTTLTGFGAVFVGWHLGLHFTAYTLPFSAAVAAPGLWLGTRLLFGARASRDASIRSLAALALLMGLHLLDFPFLRLNKAFAPFGFGIALIISSGLAIAAPLTVLDRQRRSAQLRERLVRRAKRRTHRLRDEYLNLTDRELTPRVARLKAQLEKLNQELDAASEHGASKDRLKRTIESAEIEIQRIAAISDQWTSSHG